MGVERLWLTGTPWSPCDKSWLPLAIRFPISLSTSISWTHCRGPETAKSESRQRSLYYIQNESARGKRARKKRAQFGARRRPIYSNRGLSENSDTRSCRIVSNPSKGPKSPAQIGAQEKVRRLGLKFLTYLLNGSVRVWCHPSQRLLPSPTFPNLFPTSLNLISDKWWLCFFEDVVECNMVRSSGASGKVW